MGECRKLHNDHSLKDRNISLTDHVLILNLALSDLLMGVYLLCLGIFDYIYRGQYCIKSVEWLSSYKCQALGVLVVISSQTSVLMLTLLATFRLNSVIRVSAKMITIT